MRAIEPTQSGNLTLEGFQIGYEVFGDAAAPAVLLLPCWQIVHSRHWKMQVPYLARFFRVITYDPPGNGGGERTTDPRAFEYDRIADQGVGLLDYLAIERAAVIGFSRGTSFALTLAARYPERMTRLVLIGNGAAPGEWPPPIDPRFLARRAHYEGWDKRNAHYWRAHYDEWIEFFFHEIFPEPHSTKPIEDCIAWAQETTPDILIQTVNNAALFPPLSPSEILERISCPVLLIHGTDDRCDPLEASQHLAAARPDWELVTLAGCGHAPHVRDPVRVNREIARFLGC